MPDGSIARLKKRMKIQKEKKGRKQVKLDNETSKPPSFEDRINRILNLR